MQIACAHHAQRRHIRKQDFFFCFRRRRRNDREVSHFAAVRSTLSENWVTSVCLTVGTSASSSEQSDIDAAKKRRTGINDVLIRSFQ